MCCIHGTQDAVSGQGTTRRIFPGPGGMDTVLETMLSETTKRIEQAQVGQAGQTSAAAFREPIAFETKASRRGAIKVRFPTLDVPSDLLIPTLNPLHPNSS
jgi:hypothetical protein